MVPLSLWRLFHSHKQDVSILLLTVLATLAGIVEGVLHPEADIVKVFVARIVFGRSSLQLSCVRKCTL